MISTRNPLEIILVFLCLFDNIINMMMKEFKFKPTIQNTKPFKLK